MLLCFWGTYGVSLQVMYMICLYVVVNDRAVIRGRNIKLVVVVVVRFNAKGKWLYLCMMLDLFWKLHTLVR